MLAIAEQFASGLFAGFAGSLAADYDSTTTSPAESHVSYKSGS